MTSEVGAQQPTLSWALQGLFPLSCPFFPTCLFELKYLPDLFILVKCD